MSNTKVERSATHAGSWYSDDGNELDEQLGHWLSQVNDFEMPARAIIAPHAGYRYCGDVSAYAFRQIDPSKVKRVFVLGPSHHVRLSSCAISPLKTYNTPLSKLRIDQEVYSCLAASGHFETMSVSADEDEHSMEMMLPFISKVFEKHLNNIRIVPVMVGSLSVEKEALYGQIFSKYLSDPSNLFVISSDFCHWGVRFRYTPNIYTGGEIWQNIEQLDRQGMKHIEEMSCSGFSSYLKETANTICGRHPIGVLLQAINALKETIKREIMTNQSTFTSMPDMKLRFLKYSQSDKCRKASDSSVSYAAASFVISH